MCAVCLNLMMPLFQVGGMEEYHIVDALKEGRITKPLVAWCIGTCSKMFSSDVSIMLL